MEPLDIRHVPSAHRFEAALDGQIARVEYQQAGKVLRLYHTEVPPAFEGRGIAGQLVRAALAYAEREGLKVEAACSYVRSYMQRHPETLKLLA